jgi:hypothetical protein
MLDKLRSLIFGPPRDVTDPEIFHTVSLVAFLAWIGLGADGLSSCCYGPNESFLALGTHPHLAIIEAALTAVTIIVISIAYSNLIEHFPGGGGGYLVATKLLGRKAGVVSGCALLIDYVLTITVSVACGCDALWSFLPHGMVPYKLACEAALLVILVLVNLRGVKDSVMLIVPIFLLFMGTHAFMILYAFAANLSEMPDLFRGASADFRTSVSAMGFAPLAFLILRSYSLGGGTYTGIEAVSNGVTILREPRVATGKKTMALMAVSLAFTSGGILFSYLLAHVSAVPDKTLNAVLTENLFGTWHLGGFAVGRALIVTTLFAEAALLFIAAQTGFIDGPRVLANMAVDSWMPHRFATLSERLVTNNGVYVMGAAALAALFYTRGDVSTIVVMYSINVFITFSLTELGMARHWIVDREKEPRWKSQLAIHGTGLIMCVSILCLTLYEKFTAGGWMTAVLTGAAVALCFMIHRHYQNVNHKLKRLDALIDFIRVPGGDKIPTTPIDRRAPTAVVMVKGFSGFGLHQILSIQKLFPYYFKNFVFLSTGVVDSGNFKGTKEISSLEAHTKADLAKYVDWVQRHGFHAESRMDIGTEAVDKLIELCPPLAKDFPHAIFFTGKLIFEDDKLYHVLLHNETAYAIQRRLQFKGLQSIILPIRVI